MAVTVARVHLAMAHAALPGLLPTPPEWKAMAPQLPTPARSAAAVILQKQSLPSKPGRADSVDRWDTCKNTTISNNKKSPSSKSTSRADAVDRWDSNKKNKATTSSSSSSSRSSISSSISPASRSASSSSRERWGSSNKQPSSCGSSSAERWDAHKKPRPNLQSDDRVRNDDGQSHSSTGSNDVDMELDDEAQPQMMGLYAGPGILAAPPQPKLLPIPALLVLPRYIVA